MSERGPSSSKTWSSFQRLQKVGADTLESLAAQEPPKYKANNGFPQFKSMKRPFFFFFFKFAPRTNIASSLVAVGGTRNSRWVSVLARRFQYVPHVWHTRGIYAAYMRHMCGICVAYDSFPIKPPVTASKPTSSGGMI